MAKRKSQGLREVTAVATDGIGPANGFAHEGALGVVYVVGCHCRCGYQWKPRVDEKPRTCPKCKSPNWDRPRVR